MSLQHFTRRSLDGEQIASETVALDISAARSRAVDFLALSKPRVVLMVLLTAVVGYYVGSSGDIAYGRMVAMLIGTALAAGGTLALNQYIERNLDARMERTRLRPLPDGRLQPTEALLFGAIVTASGLLYLTVAVNTLSGLVTAFTSASYLFLYTPMKQRTSLCSVVGAVPGALPPVTGWVAARGDIGIEACVLFGILFLWQLPHSLAIAWLYRADYARAGMQLLPVIEPDGRSTGRYIAANCVALFAVALLPTLLGFAGGWYLAVALALGGGLVVFGVALARARTPRAARRLLFATLAYLPILLVAMALDRVPL